MRRSVSIRAALSGAALVAGLVGTAQAAERYLIHVVPDFAGLEAADNGAPVLVSETGRRFLIRLKNGTVNFQPITVPERPALPRGALPDAVVGYRPDTRGGALAAWLDQPTTRYGHAVLGDGIEAGGLSVRYGDGSVGQLTLAADRVFEDRLVRITGYDYQGRAALMTVTSYLDAGAALTLVDPGAPGGAAPRVLAEAPAIGTPNRWLNPVGAADVDGDGRVEFLAVITPHIGGTLRAYEHHGPALVADHALEGFSNHAYGSRELGLSGLADLDNPPDGIAEAIVPNAMRDAMKVVRFSGGPPRIVASLAPGARIIHKLVIHDLDGDGVPELIFGAENNSLVIWTPGIDR